MRKYEQCDAKCTPRGVDWEATCTARGTVEIVKVTDDKTFTLYMCGHHAREHADGLEAAGWQLFPDESAKLWLGPDLEHLIPEEKPAEAPATAFS